MALQWNPLQAMESQHLQSRHQHLNPKLWIDAETLNNLVKEMAVEENNFLGNLQ